VTDDWTGPGSNLLILGAVAWCVGAMILAMMWASVLWTRERIRTRREARHSDGTLDAGDR